MNTAPRLWLAHPNTTWPQVPNDDDAAAAAMVNTSDYGLGSSVFSANQVRPRALRMLAWWCHVLFTPA